jgi:hypothetical protein
MLARSLGVSVCYYFSLRRNVMQARLNMLNRVSEAEQMARRYEEIKAMAPTMRDELDEAGALEYDVDFSWTRVVACSLVPSMTLLGIVIATFQWL